MNLNINKVILLGRIASEITYKDELGKDKVSIIFLATNRKWKDRDGIKKEQATFHKVLFFGQIAEVIKDLGTKGEVLLVEGRIQHKDIFDEKTNSYSRDVAVIAEKFQLGTETYKKDDIKDEKLKVDKEIKIDDIDAVLKRVDAWGFDI